MTYLNSEKLNRMSNGLKMDVHLRASLNRLNCNDVARNFYLDEEKKIKYLNTNKNHNDDSSVQLLQIRERFGLIEPRKDQIQKDVQKSHLLPKMCHGDITDNFFKDKFIRRPTSHRNLVDYHRDILTQYSQSIKYRQFQTNFRNEKPRESKYSNHRRLSNNADVHMTQIPSNNTMEPVHSVVIKSHLAVSMAANQEHLDYNKKATSLPSNIRYSRDREAARQRSNPSVDGKVHWKPHTTQSCDRKSISRNVIMRNATRPLRDYSLRKFSSTLQCNENQSKEKYFEKLKQKQTEWSKLHRLKKFETAMNCANEINSRLNGMNGMSGTRLRRYHIMDDLDFYPTFRKHKVRGGHSKRLESTLVTSGRRNILKKEMISPICVVMCPIIMRPSLAVNSLRDLKDNIKLSYCLLKENLTVMVYLIDVLEPIAILSDISRRMSRAKNVIQHEDLYENLTEVIIHELDVVDKSSSLWGNDYRDSWDEISATSSSSSTGTDAMQDYKSISSDNLCNTDDIYGSDIEEGDNEGGSDTKCLNLDKKKFSSENYSMSLVDSVCSSKFSICEYEILTCSLSTESFDSTEEAEKQFDLVSMPLSLVQSSISVSICPITSSVPPNSHCPLLSLLNRGDKVTCNDLVPLWAGTCDTVSDMVFMALGQTMTDDHNGTMTVIIVVTKTYWTMIIEETSCPCMDLCLTSDRIDHVAITMDQTSAEDHTVAIKGIDVHYD